MASALIDLPSDFQLAPIVQFATARPYSPIAGFDVNGDGRSTSDRLCAGVSLDSMLAARGNSSAVRALNPRGCTQADVNSERGGFVVDANGNVTERSGRFFNLDLRVTKAFPLGDRVKFKVYADLYNLFNIENLSFSDRFGRSAATSGSLFLQPATLFGPGFGPPPGRPFTAVIGARFDF